MIQGIQSNSNSAINSILADSIKKTTSADVEQESTSSRVSKTDTVEISAEGKLASETATQSSSSDTQILLTETESVLSNATSEEIAETSDGTVSVESATSASSSATSAPSAPPSAPPSASSESDETETTTILTTLSEAQLDNLVSEGVITQAEENSELARRDAAEADSDENLDISIDDDIKLKSSIGYEQEVN